MTYPYHTKLPKPDYTDTEIAAIKAEHKRLLDAHAREEADFVCSCLDGHDDMASGRIAENDRCDERYDRRTAKTLKAVEAYVRRYPSVLDL
jgi:hypothetical protein